ncbi:MAG: SGNH/GDSL hydrolase family protein [Treponema sp.]|nr:SGNH/GDSL hydrolase family protein [Treponema sp.]
MKKIFIFIFSIFIFSSAYSQTKHISNMSDKDYSALLQESILSYGNNYNLKLFLDKIKKGEKVSIAALGGSVTEGAGPALFTDGYAYQFNRKIRTQFTKDNGKNIFFDGAGLSGTPSPIGLVRYEQDVTKVLKQNPDLLIIEFAVNDGGEQTHQRGFEALIHDALTNNPNTAIIILYSAATYGNTQNQMIPIANYYNIPQISILNIVNKSINNKTINEKDFYTDIVHPTKEGHELVADCLMQLLNQTNKNKQNEKPAIPTKSYLESNLFGFKQILSDNQDVKITSGGFNSIDSQTQYLQKTKQSNFPFNWYHKPGNSNDSFNLEINCKNLILVYKENSQYSNVKFGKADLFIDGKYIKTFDCSKNNGWGNCLFELIIDEKVSAKHSVQIKMQDDSKDLGFTIVALGYSK